VTAKDSSPSPDQTGPPDQLGFEDSLQRLESIVHDLEEGQIDLGDALTRYEEGVRLLRRCYQLLHHAERKIELLSEVDAGGLPLTEPLDDTSLSLEEKAKTRGKRRSRRGGGAESPCPEPPSDENEMDVRGNLF
jgi:exodeoxyribonuclease VII small subunit